MRSLARSAAIFLGSALGYYGCAAIGTLLSVPPSGFAIIWPATAFLISIFLITEPREWLLSIAAIIPTHFTIAASFQPNAPLVVIVTQVLGNILLALVTVAAVRAVLGRRLLFNTLNSILVFVGIAAVAAPALVNSIILGAHLATGWISDFWLAWRQWMIAGIFPSTILPLLVSLTATGRLTGYTTDSPHPERELAILIVLLFAVTFIAYNGSVDAQRWPVLFLIPFPFLLWAAVRLGVGGTCLSLLVFATATIVQALRHNGPFAVGSPIEHVTSLQTYLVTTSIPLILFAALIDERRQAERLLQQSEARIQRVASATDTCLWRWDPERQSLWASESCRLAFKLKDSPDLTPDSLLEAVVKADRDRMQKAIRSALSFGADTPSGEYRVQYQGGVRWMMLSMHSDLDEAGSVISLNGVFRDVTERKVAQLEASRLRKQLMRIRQDERRRISEELHDSTVQHLVAAKLGLALLDRGLRAKEKRSMLSDAMQSIGDALQEIRTFSYLLHPPQLGNIGLSAALQNYVPGFESRTGIHTSLRLNTGLDRLPIAHQHAILRIAQESLGNVHRHAAATNVSINVRLIAASVHVLVKDDGKGISLEAGQQLSDRLRLGVGIPSMTARVKRLHGRMEINSGSAGTTIHVAIPLPEKLAATLH